VSTASSNPVLPEGWEMVIGLEVHAELHTVTKMFSAAPNNFGDEPNTNIDAVTLGLPGSLPVLNEQAVELAIRFGIAASCTIAESVFSRKNYFYPDQPKDFQISQYDLPICANGFLDLPNGTRIGITRAHLEEDTGKTTHDSADGRLHGSVGSLVDYNRAGVPLLEIVSEPDLRNSEDAKAYVTELRAILLAAGISDAKMEEGSMRVDANVSIRRTGEEFGTRCEVKNVNSIRSVGRAIDYEARRQLEAITAGETIVQETRHWSEVDGRTSTLRKKENSDDYRYFPEPDLVPVAPSAEWIERVRAAMPLLPAQRRAWMAERFGVSPNAESVALSVDRGLDDFALSALDGGGDAARVLVHVEHNMSEVDPTKFDVNALVALTKMEVGNKLSATHAKAVLAEMLEHNGGDPEAIAARMGFEAISQDATAAMLDEAIAADPEAWASYLTGNEKAAGALTGRIMKATKGKADGKAIAELMQSRRAAQ
jgi:aspartyl-tRNA(Asn)/glutamyl-tRNA(Gln) amidotransferase subunit B